MDFSELRLLRRSLRAFCTDHPLTIAAFRNGQSYRNELTDKPEEPAEELRHLTSTATCLESLGDAAERALDLTQRRQEFAQAALSRPPERWTSDGSAKIYCRCRALPLVITGLPSYDERVEAHLTVILRQLDMDDRFAIGEADPETPDEAYPPNAFHTYWTLEIFDRIKQRFPDCPLLPGNNETMHRRRNAILLWLRQVVGTQIAFHNSKSAASDTDQLVWALACVLRETREWAWVQGEQDLLRQALAAIFSTQLETGNWPNFRPLFHYHKVGNAYCYIFESLSGLLRVALLPDAVFLRGRLKEYCDRLARLWRFADATAIPLPSQLPGSSLRGWSSGHRSNSPWAESWATASVFSFAQLLRRLVGIWTSESALQGLNLIPAKGSREEAKKELVDRGNTWSKRPVSQDLLSLFVNPVRMCATSDTSLDPDRSPILKEHARSAILHGPPGTSKTTLVQAVAGALGWRYVEIHASHFVSDGLPNVQRRADEIFERLMELDRAVVLFDEVDELVREREEGKADVFGRFLTTSMLPKLAELWKSQRILYFVATNHVRLFDAAIIRSQRFDAIIFVPPPSFERKSARLAEIIQDVSGRETRFVGLSARDCEVAAVLVPLENAGEDLASPPLTKAKTDKDLPSESLLAKFILLRWDQLDELVYRLGVRAEEEAQLPVVVEKESLAKALAEIADDKLAKVAPYQEYLRGRDFARRDFGKYKVWVMDGDLPPSPTRHFKRTSDGRWWLIGVVEDVEGFQIPGWRLVERNPGEVTVSRDDGPHEAAADRGQPSG
jgi:hypothetical protein